MMRPFLISIGTAVLLLTACCFVMASPQDQYLQIYLLIQEGEKLEATAAPNPTSTSFNLVIKGNRKSPVSVKVIDISGRVVERHEKVPANSNFKMGQRLAAGSYFIEVVQDDQKKIIRVIKVN
jgi:hypothetical protein